MIDQDVRIQAEVLEAALPYVAVGGAVLDLCGGLAEIGVSCDRISATVGVLPASNYDLVAVLALHRPGIDPIGLLKAGRRALRPGGRLVAAGRVDFEGGYSCSAEGMEALLKYLGFQRTLAARPDLCGGRAYLVAAQK